MTIKVKAASNMLVFEESSGSTFVVAAHTFQGLRTYGYHNHDTGTEMFAVKIFFDINSQQPIIYNEYSTKQEADDEASKLVKCFLEAKEQ